jgi:DNA primase
MQNLDVELIKESLSISEVIEGYGVELKSVGNGRFMGKCPFHDDRLPSLSVSDTDGYHKCFAGCSQGDVIKFIQKIDGISFKDAVVKCKHLAGINDQFLTPDQRILYERKVKADLEARRRFKEWRKKLISNLITYTNCQWRIHRIAKRQLLVTYTEELEAQVETAYFEALKKERALDQLESMPESELMAWYRNERSWYGKANPPWVLSASKLKIVENERKAA